MTKILESLDQILWGAPALLGILGVGVFLSIRSGFPQFSLFTRAWKTFLHSLHGKESGASSGFQALCTALAATVGTGNLVGVAGAICIGGPGSIFWMWICGLVGMATKYAEATLAVRYRIRQNGIWMGGPMYMIQNGLGTRWQWLAKLYALFGFLAAFGVGNATQINAVISGIHTIQASFGLQPLPLADLAVGLILALLVSWILRGRGKGIGRIAERLVPFASAAYILLCFVFLIRKADRIPGSLLMIFQGAFSPKAVTGGMLGSAFSALRTGCARGVFTNEAGMGTASIAHGSADVDHPAKQGLMGIMEVFLDTIVICTLTALVILCSGVQIPYGTDAGGVLTALAFSCVYGPWASVWLSLALCCFAFATVLGWSLYGGRCAQFLFGRKGWDWFVLLQTVTVLAAAVSEPGPVWILAEIFNGLMAIPNLIALAVLSPELRRLTIDFKEKSGILAGGGTYANFYQRKPL